MTRRMHKGNELAYTLNVIGRDELLLCKDILELRIVLLGKFKTMCHLYNDASFLRFSDTTAARACHVGEEFILLSGQVNFEPTIHPAMQIEAIKITQTQVPIQNFEMDTAQFLESKIN